MAVTAARARQAEPHLSLDPIHNAAGTNIDRKRCRAPTDPEIDRFIGWLRDEGLPVRRRITKGRSVMAACGQLGNIELRAAARNRPLALRTRRD